jgi:hypothetical protein
MMRTLSLAVSTLIVALPGFTNVAVAGAHSGCAELGGNVQSGNVCHVYADTSAYTLDLRFGTDYPDEQPVTDYLTENRDRIVNAAQMPGARNLPYMMSVTSQTYTSGQPTRTTRDYGQPWHGTQSLVLNNFQSVEGATVGTRYKSFTFDFDQNRPVTFESLFAPGTNPMDSIYPVVAADLARQQIFRHFQLPPDVGRDPAHYQSFAITDDTVIFFFSTGEFLAPEAGYLSTPVSRTSLPLLQL